MLRELKEVNKKLSEKKIIYTDSSILEINKQKLRPSRIMLRSFSSISSKYNRSIFLRYGSFQSHVEPFIVRANLLLLDHHNIQKLNIAEIKQVIYSLNIVKDKKIAGPILKIIEEKVDTPDVMTLVMKSYHINNLVRESLDVFTKKLHTKPDIVNDQHLTTYLNVCKIEGRIIEGYNGFMLYAAAKNNPTSIIAASSFLSLCSSCLTPEINSTHPGIFEKILTYKDEYSSHPTIISPLLVIFGKLNRTDLVQCLYERALLHNTSERNDTPNINLLTSLLTGLSYSKDYQRAIDLMDELIKVDGVHMNAHCMSKLIDICLKAGLYNKGLSMLVDWLFNKNGNIDAYLATGILYLLQHRDLDLKASSKVSLLLKRLILRRPYQIGAPNSRTLILLAHLVDSFEDIDDILAAHTATGQLFDEDGIKIFVALISALLRKRSWQLLLSLNQRLETHLDCQPALSSLALSSCVSALLCDGYTDKAATLLGTNIIKFYDYQRRRICVRKLVQTLTQSGQSRYLPFVLQTVAEVGHANAQVLQDFLVGAPDLATVLDILRCLVRNGALFDGSAVSSMHVYTVTKLINQTGERSDVANEVISQLRLLGFDIRSKILSVSKPRDSGVPLLPA